MKKLFRCPTCEHVNTAPAGIAFDFYAICSAPGCVEMIHVTPALNAVNYSARKCFDEKEIAKLRDILARGHGKHFPNT